MLRECREVNAEITGDCEKTWQYCRLTQNSRWIRGKRDDASDDRKQIRPILSRGMNELHAIIERLYYQLFLLAGSYHSVRSTASGVRTAIAGFLSAFKNRIVA